MVRVSAVQSPVQSPYLGRQACDFDGVVVDLGAMRNNYRLVRYWWRAYDDWSDADLSEADAMIKAAVDGGDEGIITCWANWLANLARDFRAREDAVAAARGRIKAAAEKKKKEKSHERRAV